MQRSGRKGHAMFRVVVQDSRRTPTSGKIVAPLGSYDPHSKKSTLDTEKAKYYLEHGAQPSERVARLLTVEGVKLPKWVLEPSSKDRSVRNADKRRSTRPEEPVEEAPAEEPKADAEAEAPEATPAEETTPAPAAEEATTEPKEPAADAEPAAEPVVDETPAETTDEPASEEAPVTEAK